MNELIYTIIIFSFPLVAGLVAVVIFKAILVFGKLIGALDD